MEEYSTEGACCSLSRLRWRRTKAMVPSRMAVLRKPKEELLLTEQAEVALHGGQGSISDGGLEEDGGGPATLRLVEAAAAAGE